MHAEEEHRNGGPAAMVAAVLPLEGASSGTAAAAPSPGEVEMPDDGFCEECGDRPAVWLCAPCEGVFCAICFHQLHRKGRRAAHSPTPCASASSLATGGQAAASGGGGLTSWLLGSGGTPAAGAAVVSATTAAAAAAAPDRSSLLARAQYIPLRLSMEERPLLRLLEAALNVSDHTAAVDGPPLKPAARLHAQMGSISSMMGGIILAINYAVGQEALEQHDFSEHAGYLQDVFEIGRRHKIMNPEKMRSTYGKLMYLMQDAVNPAVLRELGFSVKRTIKSVYSLLKEKNGLALLMDPQAEIATREVLPSAGKTRSQIQAVIRKKEKAVDYLKRRYSTRDLDEEDIHMCLYSMCDNDSFLNSNRLPIDKTIHLLKHFFRPNEYEEGYSLGIVAGKEGARLTHSHARQYNFALQSLMLWRGIVHDMFRLWCLAEEDLLSEKEPYKLADTGQGRQRVQQSPRVFKAMQEVIFDCQQQVDVWVGSSVVHLGDHNVPNALVFIDKYTQVSRILAPIVTTIEQLGRLYEDDDGIRKLIDDGYHGIERLQKDILCDFFRSAFDGSGADNNFDAGSCIDGRLTSAWHWCSNLSKKPFYNAFKLTGFTGFDGDFQN